MNTTEREFKPGLQACALFDEVLGMIRTGKTRTRDRKETARKGEVYLTIQRAELKFAKLLKKKSNDAVINSVWNEWQDLYFKLVDNKINSVEARMEISKLNLKA